MSTTTTTTNSTPPSDSFLFPPHYSFPPFFTLQPVLATRTSQLHSWSTLIQSYCRHHGLWTLTLVDALSTPLFNNTTLSRRLSLRDARAIIQWMTTPEDGGRAEWVPSSLPSTSSSTTTLKKPSTDPADANADSPAHAKAYIFWRRPEEWAAVIEEWVERTGQKGTVLTLYEIAESDMTKKEEFWGMERGLLGRCLAVCGKRGKAQVFGREGSEGVKFF